MDLFSVGMILICGWALINFWLLPLSRDRWRVVDIRQKIARAGALAVLEKTRDLAAVGVITLAILILFIWLVGLFAGVSLEVPKTVLEKMASVYGTIKSWRDSYSTGVGIVGILGAAIALYMVAKLVRRKVADAGMDKANEVHARLLENPKEMLSISANPQLQLIAERGLKAIEQLAQHNEDGTQSSLTALHIEQLHEEASSALSLLAIEAAGKEVKFEEILKSTIDETATSLTPMQRLARIFASDRFCKDIGLIRKPLSYLVTALLVVTLIGWSAEPMANSLQLVVNNLRFNASQSEANRELDKELSVAESVQIPQTEVVNAQTIQTTTRLLARGITDSIVRTRIVDQLAGVESRIGQEKEFIRAAIAERQLDMVGGADEVTRLRREVAEGIVVKPDDAPEIQRIRRHIEGQAYPQVEKLQKRNPGLLSAVRSRLEARYSVPMAPLDAQGKLVAHMIDEALTGVEMRPSTELAKQAQKLVKELGREAIDGWVKTETTNYVKDTVAAVARNDVIQKARRELKFESSSETRKFARDMSESEGMHWIGSAAEQEEVRISHAVAEKVASHSRAEIGMTREIAERLGGYDNLFPRGGGTNPIIENGARMRQTGGVVEDAAAARGRAFAQSRASSFVLAARSFKVRGVLIGQDQPVDGLYVSGIRWKLQSVAEKHLTQIELAIRLGSEWTNLGSFDAAIVNQALRYAADRRVIATTIVPGDGQITGRITYLHPVLADTPLGCRVVEADRFVDTFSVSNGPEKATKLSEIATDREQISKWMRAVEIAEAVASLPERAVCPQEEVEKALSQVGKVKISRGVRSAFDHFLTAEEAKKVGSTKFLRSVLGCRTDSSAVLSACICMKVKEDGAPRNYWAPQDHTSQFREKTARLTPDMQWMSRSKDRLGHIDLWIHTTFAVQNGRRFGGGESDVDEGTATTVDFSAKQLSLLKSVISEKLPKYLSEKMRSPTYDEFMAPLEDFVLIQRLARAGLDGKLGDAFPTMELLQLERETRQFVPYQPTIRWEPIRGSDLLRTTLKEADAKAIEKYDAWLTDQRERVRTGRPVCDHVSNQP